MGGGEFLGPHTNAHIGLHISARELIRFGYLVDAEKVVFNYENRYERQYSA